MRGWLRASPTALVAGEPVCRQRERELMYGERGARVFEGDRLLGAYDGARLAKYPFCCYVPQIEKSEFRRVDPVLFGDCR